MSDAIFPNLWPVINYLMELWVKALHQPRYIIASDLLTVDSCCMVQQVRTVLLGRTVKGAGLTQLPQLRPVTSNFCPRASGDNTTHCAP